MDRQNERFAPYQAQASSLCSRAAALWWFLRRLRAEQRGYSAKSTLTRTSRALAIRSTLSSEIFRLNVSTWAMNVRSRPASRASAS